MARGWNFQTCKLWGEALETESRPSSLSQTIDHWITNDQWSNQSCLHNGTSIKTPKDGFRELLCWWPHVDTGSMVNLGGHESSIQLCVLYDKPGIIRTEKEKKKKKERWVINYPQPQASSLLRIPEFSLLSFSFSWLSLWTFKVKMLGPQHLSLCFLHRKRTEWLQARQDVKIPKDFSEHVWSLLVYN